MNRQIFRLTLAALNAIRQRAGDEPIDIFVRRRVTEGAPYAVLHEEPFPANDNEVYASTMMLSGVPASFCIVDRPAAGEMGFPRERISPAEAHDSLRMVIEAEKAAIPYTVPEVNGAKADLAMYVREWRSLNTVCAGTIKVPVTLRDVKRWMVVDGASLKDIPGVSVS